MRGTKKSESNILPTFATAMLYRIDLNLGNPDGNSQGPFRLKSEVRAARRLFGGGVRPCAEIVLQIVRLAANLPP
jgi:hypothetical protein